VAVAGGIAAAIRAVRGAVPGLPLEIECDSLAQVHPGPVIGGSRQPGGQLHINQLRKPPPGRQPV